MLPTDEGFLAEDRDNLEAEGAQVPRRLEQRGSTWRNGQARLESAARRV
jgi:hypothetical protein